MQKVIDTGVFIPVGKNGWTYSVNVPDTPGTYQHVLDVVQKAEAVGFDFVLSPAIWRGRKGPSGFWTNSLESLTTTAALLQATSRIHVWGTVHMTIYPPAPIAKAVATLDQIGPGRVGLNLVTGSSYLDLHHLGLWNDGLDHDERYQLGDEWIDVVKRLWTEEVVNHQGKFFEVNEGTMGPKPSTMPTLVNAGASERGFRFASEWCNAAFISAGAEPERIATAKLAKQTARSMNKPDFKTYGVLSLLPAETDAEAHERLARLDEGVDREALIDSAAGYAQNRSSKDVSAASKATFDEENASAVLPGTLVGSYETLARQIAQIAVEGEFDGILITVPDFIEDLDSVATRVFPLMPEYGVSARLGAS